MPRYIVEHGFHPDAQDTGDGSRACRIVGGRHDAGQVTWLRVYTSVDRTRSFCIYDAPSAEAVLHAASSSNLPVQEITEVISLDTHGCR
jgi:hypothetical protein